MQYPGLVLVVCGTGIGLIVVSNFFFYSIFAEVNAQSPPDRQVSMFWVNVRAFSIVRRHAELFPESRKRFQMNSFFVIGVALTIAGLLIGVAHYSNLP
jgi:hypothetical protein